MHDLSLFAHRPAVVRIHEKDGVEFRSQRDPAFFRIPGCSSVTGSENRGPAPYGPDVVGIDGKDRVQKRKGGKLLPLPEGSSGGGFDDAVVSYGPARRRIEKKDRIQRAL